MSTLTSKATSLVDLPRDILYEILSYFCLHCRGELKPVKGVGTPHQLKRQSQRPPQQRDQKSWYSLDKHALFSLALSCKSLHPIAEDFLYHEFAPGYGDSELSDLYTFEPRLHQFMRTVGKRKDLAEKVGMIFLHHRHLGKRDIKQIVASLRQGASDAGIDLVADWQRRAEHGSIDADAIKDYIHVYTKGFDEQDFVAEKEDLDALYKLSTLSQILHSELTPILLALLPNLEYASLENYRSHDWCDDDPFEAFCLELPPHLRVLEAPEDSASLAGGVSKLEELNIDYKNVSLQSDKTFCETSQIKILRLTGMTHFAPCFRGALSRTPKTLQSLVYEARQALLIENDFNAQDMIEMLQDRRQTLETLHLDLRGALWHELSPIAAYSPNFTLEGFEKLKYVFLNTGILFEVSVYHSEDGSPTSEDPEEATSQVPPLPIVSSYRNSISRRLPRSIVSLHLAWDRAEMEQIEEGLDGLADAKREQAGRFPCLRHVGFHYPGKLSEAVHQSLNAAGINFVYENWPTSF